MAPSNALALCTIASFEYDRPIKVYFAFSLGRGPRDGVTLYQITVASGLYKFYRTLYFDIL